VSSDRSSSDSDGDGYFDDGFDGDTFEEYQNCNRHIGYEHADFDGNAAGAYQHTDPDTEQW
jgi:hypothetical protein